MEIDRILYPVESLGPGKRVVVWTIGCSKHCKNCSNKELWEKNNKKDIPSYKVLDLIKNICKSEQVDGITFTGGDPFEQKDELIKIIEGLDGFCEDILVYTGYTEKELYDLLSEEEAEKVKTLVSVLIEGPYVDELNDNVSCLKGSSNQRIIIYNKNLCPIYNKYIKQGRKIQNFYVKNRAISVGIHNKED